MSERCYQHVHSTTYSYRVGHVGGDCCSLTLIKYGENLICSLVFLIYLTIRMRIILKSESAVYRQSPRYVYEGSFFIWHNRPIPGNAYETDRNIRIYRINKIIRPTRKGISILIVTYITSFLTFVIESRPTLYIVKLS